jgi:hypothetical protein
VYLKDIVFDEHGRPVLLYLTTGGYQRTPENDPRTWSIARWTGETWIISHVTESDHNYDFGQLYLEDDGTWRIIAPTESGPQPYMTGGEIAIWTSRDQGETWQRLKQLTQNSPRNHTYVRRPTNAHPDFYAWWADGNADELSESYLYFTNQAGDAVWQLPKQMTQEQQQPQVWDGK